MHDKNDKDSKRVEFNPPKDFAAPENVQAGDEFDLVCTLRLKDDGKICLLKVGDFEMPGYGKDDDDDHRPSYNNVAKPMMAEQPASLNAGVMGGDGSY